MQRNLAAVLSLNIKYEIKNVNLLLCLIKKQNKTMESVMLTHMHSKQAATEGSQIK